MAVSWTEDQKKAITLRKRNLLVSAAAGSGKTAVLVERIVEMATDREHPIDLDRMLVMTFTNAAASEMRERVQAAIEKRREETPEDEHLEMQSILVSRAQITTIDSFCLSFIREYYNTLDIDPAFRIGDEGELALLQADVMGKLLEDQYSSGNKEFLDFVDTYGAGKSDAGIEEIIFQVWRFSQSYPWPEEWFELCRKELEGTSFQEIEKSRWMEFFMKDVRLQAEEFSGQLSGALTVCEGENGPAAYADRLAEDAEMMAGFSRVKNYKEFYGLLSKAAFGKLPPIRSKDVDSQKKAFVSACRDRAKKVIKKWKETFLIQPPDEILEAQAGTRGPVRILLELAEEYTARYQEAKKERNLADFGDLEHFALKILWKEETGEDGARKRVPSEAADEMSRKYEVILVDEYQDSNLVQETLIQALSRERYGKPNVFMVGDVKQSIYRFRLARPDLFLEKYQTYRSEDSLYQKVELHQNFRSRAQVLEAVNDICYQIMTKNLGGIQYTREAALYPGAEFEIPEDGREKLVGTPAELIIVPTDSSVMDGLDDDARDYTERELEARMAAEKILHLTDSKDGLPVWDKARGAYRTARFGDIVILLRSITGWAETYVNILMNAGIPAAAQTQTGYFDTPEVETVLSLLAITDNPFQDIPMAAVLRSPVISMTDEEMAWLMAGFKKQGKKEGDRGMYAAVRMWLYDEDKQELSAAFPKIREKLEKLEKMLEEFRFLATYLPIHELIHEIYQRSGYYDYVAAMPGGTVRKANLDMLAEKASAYEKTSYRGLFHFIRYIEKLKKYETDFGEAGAGDMTDTVRIMSIHKSKGLEFPIVILAGMGKRFNKQDMTGKVLIDPELGIAADCLDLERRVKISTLKKQVLKRRADLETLGEELRIFYVAMTRAKEKLIMTASDRSLDKRLEKYGIDPTWSGGRDGKSVLGLLETQRKEGEEEPARPLPGLPFTILSGASSYLDWVLMSFSAMRERGRLCLEICPAENLVGREVTRQMERRSSREDLLSMDLSRIQSSEVRDSLDRELSFSYPCQADTSLYAMLSVSEIKSRWQEEEAKERGETERLAVEALQTDCASLDRKKTSLGPGGPVRGTAFHRVLQLLDFSRFVGMENGGEQIGKTKDALKELETAGLLTKKDADMANVKVLAEFVAGELGQRMAKAQREGRLHREQQFMVGIPAREMKAADSDELVLVQGMIDAWIQEPDGLVLIDYKTDAAGPGDEDALKEKYRIQLDYYKKALEQITGEKVKECILYSLALQKAIRL